MKYFIIREDIMDIKEQYIVLSLQTHLFSARIMKEHSIFLKAGFTPQNQDYIKKAEHFKNDFERVLARAVKLGNGIISPEVVQSEELVTKFTKKAEEQTQMFTGINIDQNITMAELRLRFYQMPYVDPMLFHTVHLLNREALRLLDDLIQFKENILENMLSCTMFTANYPLLIEHIIREAKLYRAAILNYENNNFDRETMRETEQFWNRIMMEHALFIRGLLDPTEDKLIKAADNFADDYKKLLSEARTANDAALTADTLNETLRFKNFKTAGVAGIENCEIRSIILPLLADHVLREANHYIRLLSW